jgi:hypothetical protein
MSLERGAGKKSGEQGKRAGSRNFYHSSKNKGFLLKIENFKVFSP